MRSGEFLGGECIHRLGKWYTPKSMGTEALVLRTFTDFDLCALLHLAIHLYPSIILVVNW